MGKYFNRGRGNLPLTLANGNSASVPGNSWIELNGSDETTPSVMRAVRKGQLFRAKDPPKEDPKPVEVKTEAEATEEAPQDAAPAESKPQTAAKKVVKKKTTSKKTKAAKRSAKKTASKRSQA